MGNLNTETQPVEDGADRLVWMFPIRPFTENDVKKPSTFVFKDMEDYKKNGKNIDAKYNAGHGELYFRFKNKWHSVKEYASDSLKARTIMA